MLLGCGPGKKNGSGIRAIQGNFIGLLGIRKINKIPTAARVKGLCEAKKEVK